MPILDADPGLNFDSDAQRRVLAHLPLPAGESTGFAELLKRITPDEHSRFEITKPGRSPALQAVLLELRARGDATDNDGGWKQTPSGFDELNAEIPADHPDNDKPDRFTPAQAAAHDAEIAEQEREHKAEAVAIYQEIEREIGAKLEALNAG